MKKSLFVLFTLITACVMALIIAEMMKGAEAGPNPVPQAAVHQASLQGAVANSEGRGSHSLDQGSDACPATVIGALPYTDTGTTTGRVDNFSPGCVELGAPDVIYQFTPGVTQLYTVSLCGSSYNTGLSVSTGGACPGTTEVACNSGFCGQGSQVTVTLTSGVTYYIIVDGYYWNDFGNYILNVFASQPSGDSCASVINIPTFPDSTSGTTIGMADNYHANGNTSPDVIYSFTPTVSQSYRISLCGSSYNTLLEVRTGGACPGATQVAVNDDGCRAVNDTTLQPQSMLDLDLNAGTTYYIIVDGSGPSSSGHYVLQLLVPPCSGIQYWSYSSVSPSWASWGYSVAVDCNGHIFFTDGSDAIPTLYEMTASGSQIPPSHPTVLASNHSTRVRIDEMSWDNDHQFLWGASGHVGGQDVDPSQIYTIDPATGYCTFRFPGLGLGLLPNIKDVTTGLAYDHDPMPTGSIWQILEHGYPSNPGPDPATVTRFRLMPDLSLQSQDPGIHPQDPYPAGYSVLRGVCVASGDNLYITSNDNGNGVGNNCALINKNTGAYVSSFHMVPGCSFFGLECDAFNFPGQTVLWSRDSYSDPYYEQFGYTIDNHFTAYAIPDSACPCTRPNCHVFTSVAEKFWMYCSPGNTMIVNYTHPWPMRACSTTQFAAPPCGNSDVYSWNPSPPPGGTATLLTHWDWNVPGSSYYVGNGSHGTRYIPIPPLPTTGGWYYVEPFHPVFTSSPWNESCLDSFMVCYRCSTGYHEASLETRDNYAGFIVGGVERPPRVSDDGDFGHLTGNLVDAVLQPGLSLQSLPLVVGPAGVDTLRLRYNIVRQNGFWRSMKFWAAVGDSGPAVLRIRASGAQLPDVTLAINGPGEYIAQLGAIADTGSHSLTLTTLSGNVMFDAWGTYSNFGGLCDTLPAEKVTVLWIGNNAVLHFNAPACGRYRIYSTTNRNISFSPGTWTVEATLNVPLSGDTSWTDPGAMVDYKRYTITQLCPDVQ